MSNEELVELIQEDIDREENLTKLYEQNKGFLVTLAKKFIGLEEMEDLLQTAYVGLQRAVAGFNPGKGTFISYAAFYVKSELRKYVETSGRGPSVSSSKISWLVALRKVRSELAVTLNREPTEEEVREAMEMPVDAFQELMALEYQTSVTSLDAPREASEDGDSVTLKDITPDPGCFEDDIEEELDIITRNRDLQECLDALPDKQRNVLQKYYMEGQTLEAIAEEQHITKEGVRQQRNKALQKLRDGIEGEVLRKYWHYERVSSKGFRGGYRSFVGTGESIVERLAIEFTDGAVRRAWNSLEDDEDME